MGDEGFAIRAHELSSSLIELRHRLVDEFGADRVWILSDDFRGRRVWPTGWQVVSIDPDVLDGIGLRHREIERPGWRLGDYGLYLWALQEPDLRHYWVTEPDVHFALPSIRDWVEGLSAHEEDLLVPRFGPAPEGWLWRPALAELTSGPVYRCLFPLSRSTEAAVDAAYQLRLRIGEAEPRVDPYPNDESVVATAAAQAGLRVAPLEDLCPGQFDYFAATVKVWRESLLRRHPDRELVVHSALSYEQWARWFTHFLGNHGPAERHDRMRQVAARMAPEDLPVLHRLAARD